MTEVTTVPNTGADTKVQRNFLKVRDDRESVLFRRKPKGTPDTKSTDKDGEMSQHTGEDVPDDKDHRRDSGKQEYVLELENPKQVDWVADPRSITLKELRARIEPWLTALFQSEHLSVLLGSGLSKAVSHIAGGSAADMSGRISAGKLTDKLEGAAKRSAADAGRNEGNIEDWIRTANELLRGLEILEDQKQADRLRKGISDTVSAFAKSILAGERSIAAADKEKRECALSYLVTFLMSFASRSGPRDRLNIFTTNYDRLIEVGAELAGLHLLDRFVGNLAPIFRSSRLDIDMHYNPPGMRGEPRYLEGVARFTKLHGSLDWVEAGRVIRRIGLPFGAHDIGPYLRAPGLVEVDINKLMIYPNAAKDRETAEYPYVELFRDLAAAICRPNSTLVTYGFGFGDEHISRVIRDMLTIPSTHLVVISYDNLIDRIEQLVQEHRAQVSLLVGPVLSDLETLTNYFLPKAAIDRATLRMSDLLRQRLGSTPHPEAKSEPPNTQATEEKSP